MKNLEEKLINNLRARMNEKVYYGPELDVIYYVRDAFMASTWSFEDMITNDRWGIHHYRFSDWMLDYEDASYDYSFEKVDYWQ